MALKKKYKVLIFTVVILVLLGLFYTYFVQIRQVKSGEIGVKASIGSPIDNSKDYDVEAVKGYVIFMPVYTDFVTYPTTIQLVNYDSMLVVARDGVQFYINPDISYQLDEKKADVYYRSCRLPFSEVGTGYLKTLVSGAYAAAANGFMSDSLVNNMQQFEASAGTMLSAKMNDVGLLLKNSTSNLRIPASIKEIIDLRSLALQNAILAEDKRKQAEAEVLLEIVKADGIRKEDSLRNSSLTPLAIQKMFIDKWDGKLPVYGDTPKIYKNITE